MGGIPGFRIEMIHPLDLGAIRKEDQFTTRKADPFCQNVWPVEYPQLTLCLFTVKVV